MEASNFLSNRLWWGYNIKSMWSYGWVDPGHVRMGPCKDVFVILKCYFEVLYPSSIRSESLYFIPPSSQARGQLLLPLQQVSTLANKLLRLASPNLIQEVSPLHLSQMHPLNFPSTSSIKSSKDLDSTTNHLLPPLGPSIIPQQLSFLSKVVNL